MSRGTEPERSESVAWTAAATAYQAPSGEVSVGADDTGRSVIRARRAAADGSADRLFDLTGVRVDGPAA